MTASPAQTEVDAGRVHDNAELVPCNLCGADDTRELYRLSDIRFGVDDIEWPLVQCRRCTLAYVNPRPRSDSIDRYYPRRFYGSRQESVLKRRYEVQAEYLDGLTPGAILDVGCANGDWIQLMARRGWDVHGLEPSVECENPHGLRIRHGRFPDAADWPAASFDVITAWAVFEHLHDPLAAFRRAAELLRPGGRLLILVTNIRSVASRFGYQEDIPRHLYMFSERTLAKYAEATGLALEGVVHDARIFGGAGRGTLRTRALEAAGWNRRDALQFVRMGRRKRLASHPLAAIAELPLVAFERVALSDWLMCAARANQIIVATLRKRA